MMIAQVEDEGLGVDVFGQPLADAGKLFRRAPESGEANIGDAWSDGLGCLDERRPARRRPIVRALFASALRAVGDKHAKVSVLVDGEQVLRHQLRDVTT